MPELLSSKIIISEEEPTIRGFPTLPTAVLAIEGVAERGPIAEATLLTAYSEYERYFGGFIDGYELALAVRGYFLNGGQRCYVVRTCHFTDPSSKATATAEQGYVELDTDSVAPGSAEVTGSVTGPFLMQSGDTLVGSVDGLGDQTATFTGTPAAVECATAETYDFSTGGETLTLKVDRGAVQTVTFQTSDFAVPASGTAEEVAQAINKAIYGGKAKVTTAGTKVTLESDKAGTGSYIEVTGGTANAILSFSTSEVQGTGNVANIRSVTVSEIETIVEAAWTNGGGVAVTSASGAVKIATVDTGSTATLQVQVSSTLDGVLGLDNDLHSGTDTAVVPTLKIWGKTPGAYANGLKIKITAASSGEASEFNLQVLKGTDVLESFANVTMDDTESRYVETVVNHEDSGSWYVTAEDLDAVGTPTTRRPANTSGTALGGGDDGLTSLDYNDYIGDKSAKTGLYAFDAADDITILAVPDATDANTQKAMIQYCEVDRAKLVFSILDPQAECDAQDIISQLNLLGSEGKTEMAALYWPRLVIANPSKTIYGSTVLTINVCPSGYIAGIMARNDRTYTEGPFFQPAGTEGGKPYGVVGLETDEVKFEEKRDLVFPKRINPITYLRGYGIFVDGARTLKGDGNFPSVGERRGVSYIEALLVNGLQWVRHRNNTPTLRQQVNKEIYSLLHGWMRKGAFASNTPDTAFFVDTSDALNPPSVQRSGQLVVRVGLATASPAEFIIIKVTKDTRALEAELFGT